MLSTDSSNSPVSALMAAASGSDYFELSTMTASNKSLADIEQKAMEGGEDPERTQDAYSGAFEVLEAYRWNELAVDTEDIAVHSVMSQYLKRLREGGSLVCGTVGEKTSVPFDTRLQHAKALNSAARKP